MHVCINRLIIRLRSPRLLPNPPFLMPTATPVNTGCLVQVSWERDDCHHGCGYVLCSCPQRNHAFKFKLEENWTYTFDYLCTSTHISIYNSNSQKHIQLWPNMYERCVYIYIYMCVCTCMCLYWNRYAFETYWQYVYRCPTLGLGSVSGYLGGFDCTTTVLSSKSMSMGWQQTIAAWMCWHVYVCLALWPQHMGVLRAILEAYVFEDG